MSNQINILLSDIYKSRKTLLELMKKQNYNVSELENFSINEVNAMRQSNQLDMLLQKNGTEPGQKIYIRYYLGKVIRPANLQEMIDDLFNIEQVLTKSDTLFIVIKDDPNETLINEIKQIWENDKIYVILESLKRLQFNILEHTLVPEHVLLTQPEIDAVLKKYNINNTNLLPEISRFDPVARVIGLRPGDVCLIKRSSKTAIETNYYRVCI